MTFKKLSYALLTLLLLFGCSDDPVQTGTDPGDNGNGNGSFSYSHTASPGSSNEDFVTSRNFSELIVEIQYMPGTAPTEQAIDNLQSFLEQHLIKSSITILEPEEIPSGGQESYSAADVRSIEAEHRTRYTEEGVLASYALFLDGEFSTANVLGIAYYNTSTAYFAETIGNISGGVGQPSRATIESTVFNHEYGHLMGLVNNGTEMVEDHHDEENGAHCTEQECLMYFSVNTTDFFANLFGGSIPELDDFCVADLDQLKTETVPGKHFTSKK